MKQYKFGILSLGLIALVGCGGESTNEGDTTGSLGSIDTTTTTTTEVPEVSTAFYQVPTPDELFNLIKSSGAGAGDMSLLNDPANVENYVDNKSKALNFGMYSTDLAYSSSFNQGVETLKYYSSVRRLGDDLGISSAFNATMIERIESNLDQGDSLLNISKETYFNAYDYLEQNERGPTLALVITGGWVESLFIVSNMVSQYDANNETIDRLAEQKFTLEHLLEFLKKYESEDDHVASTIADLQALKTIYDGVEEVEFEVESNEGGRNTLGGTPTKLVLTEAQFNELVSTLATLRNTITGATTN